MKPRVLITIDTCSIGGVGKVILQFLKYGGIEMCEPTVAGFWRGPDRRWQFREAVEAIDVRFEVLRQSFAFDPLVILDTLAVVRKNNVNILESHGYKSHIVCLAIKEITKLPWIAYVHGWTSENLKVEAYYLSEKLIVRFADRIIPVSENLKSRLHLGRKATAKAMVVGNAADLVKSDRVFPNVREQYGVADDEMLLTVVGRLSPEKGHRFFVDAFKKINESYNGKVKAFFVGEGQERESLTRNITESGLNDKIILTGYQEDMDPFYHATDLVVLPSLSEGMPNAALEAMVFAKPVIATTVGGIPEVVLDGKTGYLVEPRNPGALAEAVCGLIRNRDKMKVLGIAGKQRVEAEFNPNVRVRKIVDMYQTLLDLPAIVKG